MSIDEPWINFRQRITYEWVTVKKKDFINADTNTFKLIFMVGFLKQRFYGIVEASSSNNSNSFIDNQLYNWAQDKDYKNNILKIYHSLRQWFIL